VRAWKVDAGRQREAERFKRRRRVKEYGQEAEEAREG